jgi:hypothetical protein
MVLFNTEIEKIINEYNYGNYVKVRQMINDLTYKLDLYESNQIIDNALINSRINLLDIIRQNSGVLIILFISTLVLIMVSYRSFSNIASKKNYRSLKKELVITKKMLAKIQTDYYKKRIIDKESYEKISENYQEKIIDLSKNIFLIEKSSGKQ